MGIDHHTQYSHMTLMDENGKVLKAGRVLSLRSDVEEFLRRIGDEIVTVIEAGFSSYVMVDLLEVLVAKVKIADPSSEFNKSESLKSPKMLQNLAFDYSETGCVCPTCQGMKYITIIEAADIPVVNVVNICH